MTETVSSVTNKVDRKLTELSDAAPAKELADMRERIKKVRELLAEQTPDTGGDADE